MNLFKKFSFCYLIIAFLLSVNIIDAMLLTQETTIKTSSLKQYGLCNSEQVTFNAEYPINWQEIFLLENSDLNSDHEQLMQANNIEVAFNQVASLILDNRMQCLRNDTIRNVISYISIKRLQFALLIQFNYLSSIGYINDSSEYLTLLDTNFESICLFYSQAIISFLNFLNGQFISEATFTSKASKYLFNQLRNNETTFRNILNLEYLRAIQPLEYAKLTKPEISQIKINNLSGSNSSSNSSSQNKMKRKASTQSLNSVSLCKPIYSYYKSKEASESQTSSCASTQIIACSSESSNLTEQRNNNDIIESKEVLNFNDLTDSEELRDSWNIPAHQNEEIFSNQNAEKEKLINKIIDSIKRKTFFSAKMYGDTYRKHLSNLKVSQLQKLDKFFDLKDSPLNNVYDTELNNLKLYKFFAEELTKFNQTDLNRLLCIMQERNVEEFKKRIKELRKNINDRSSRKSHTV